MKSREDNIKKKLGKRLKDYMNAEEANYFLYLKVTAEHMTKYRETLSRYGNLTQEEHKYLKMSETFVKKFIELVESRMSEKQNKFFEKKVGKYAIKIIDAYTEKRLLGQWEEQLKLVKIPREPFEDWCAYIMEAKCRDCQKNHKECQLHDLFLENFVPESTWNLPNCRYAYLSNEMIEFVKEQAKQQEEGKKLKDLVGEKKEA